MIIMNDDYVCMYHFSTNDKFISYYWIKSCYFFVNLVSPLNPINYATRFELVGHSCIAGRSRRF